MPKVVAAIPTASSMILTPGIYVAGTGRELQTPIPFDNLATFQSAGNPSLTGTKYQLAAKPGNLIDPVAQKMMSYYPQPTFAPGSAGYNPYNNWLGSGANVGTNNQFDIRIDQRFTEKDRFLCTLLASHGHL